MRVQSNLLSHTLISSTASPQGFDLDISIATMNTPSPPTYETRLYETLITLCGLAIDLETTDTISTGATASAQGESSEPEVKDPVSFHAKVMVVQKLDESRKSLFDLPGEIRDRRFEMYLPRVPINIACLEKYPIHRALNETHPRVRWEFERHFYSNHTFWLDARSSIWPGTKGTLPNIGAWQIWLASIGNRNVGHLRTIRIDTRFYRAKLRISVAKTCAVSVKCELQFWNPNRFPDEHRRADWIRPAIQRSVDHVVNSRAERYAEAKTARLLAARDIENLSKVVLRQVPYCHNWGYPQTNPLHICPVTMGWDLQGNCDCTKGIAEYVEKLY